MSPEIPEAKTPRIVLFLIALILLVFALGAYRVQKQAAQINQIIDAQSPLIFSFENVGQAGQPKVTFVVTCELVPDGTIYSCKSTSSFLAGTPTPTPTPPPR